MKKKETKEEFNTRRNKLKTQTQYYSSIVNQGAFIAFLLKQNMEVNQSVFVHVRVQ